MKITCYGTKSKVEPIVPEQNVQKQFCKTNIAMEKLIQESILLLKCMDLHIFQIILR